MSDHWCLLWLTRPPQGLWFHITYYLTLLTRGSEDITCEIFCTRRSATKQRLKPGSRWQKPISGLPFIWPSHTGIQYNVLFSLLIWEQQSMLFHNPYDIHKPYDFYSKGTCPQAPKQIQLNSPQSLRPFEYFSVPYENACWCLVNKLFFCVVHCLPNNRNVKHTTGKPPDSCIYVTVFVRRSAMLLWLSSSWHRRIHKKVFA